MKTNHLVSIVMPTYNCEQFIEDSIKSIQAQTYRNWELLITDDCSSDDTIRIVESYACTDSRINVLSMNENKGAGVARNKSIERAKGRFLAFCDSDDRWCPDKLERQVRFMLDNDVSLCCSAYYICDENSTIIGFVGVPKKISYRRICSDNIMGFLTCIYDVDKVGKVLMPTIRKRQDWAYLIMLMKRCRYAYPINEPLAIYRIRKGSLSQRKYNLVKYNVRVYKEILEYPPALAWGKFIFDFMPHYLYKKCRYRLDNMFKKKYV